MSEILESPVDRAGSGVGGVLPAGLAMRDPAAHAHDVEAEWHLLETCNYRCEYCFLSAQRLGSKLRVHAGPDEWGDAFDATGRRWLIHFTGGEPTIYPKFAALCERLTRRHVISINSNLSRPAATRELAQRVDPARVSFINAGLHVAERQRHSGGPVFLANARRLTDAGFPVIVTVVATPEVLARLPAIEARCASAGLRLAPKVLRGVHGGRRFPEEYVPEEKRQLREAIARAREHYASMFAERRPSVDVLSDDALLDGVPDFLGQACSAGAKFVRIEPNGDAYRCSRARPPLGNLLRGTCRLEAGATPCDTSFCVYFCRKYTGQARLDAAGSGAQAEAAPA